MSMRASAIESTAKKVEGEFHDSNQVSRYVATQHNNCFYHLLELREATNRYGGYFICEGIYKDFAVYGQYRSLFNFYN